jgi:transposase
VNKAIALALEPHRLPAVTIGVDISDKYLHLAVVDEGGKTVLNERIANREPAIRKWFGKFRGARVALEVGTHSPWLSRLLAGMGLEVIVGNPRQIGLISGSNQKNDRIDAEKLARLARLDPDLLHPVEHRSEATQCGLAMLRARDVTVGARTSLINSVRGQVKAMGGRIPTGSAETFHQRLDNVPEALRDAMRPLLRCIEALSKEIRHYDKVIEDFCHSAYPETEMFLQIWGVGEVTSLAFLLTIEQPGRFKKSRDVGPYLGLTRRQDQSGDTDKELRITKAGDQLVRRLLVQCAHRILSEHGPDTDLRRFGLRLIERGGGTKKAKRRAVVAVARKLAILMHRLWVSGEVYEPLRNASKAA